MTNTAKHALLKENKKALQFLHNAHGFDFNNDILIFKIDGKFTYNQIIKTIYENIDEKFTAAILIKTTDDYIFNNRLHHAKITLGKFDIARTKEEYKYNIDHFFTVGDFENVRKHETKAVYVIAQRKELLTPCKNDEQLNANKRYKIAPDGVRKCSDGRGNHWVNKIAIITDRNKEIEFSPYNSFYPNEKRSDNINDYIDKSGYIVRLRRMELKRRALALKAEKELNAVNNADYTERENAIKEGIKAVKKYIIDAVNNATDYDSGRMADRATTQLTYLLHDFKNLYKYGFKSVTAKNNHFEKMETRINEILNGGKN